ncbi:hypothetical protein T03_15253 [Trichinella britovi]|uniref:Uncharacterized protein n=1 Tax=Trichinella britovi TaxID=45882 RepID=A0A0V1CDX5_TRIBR|nr:hypothetical protein T03_15253 [Trichinella britovi]
MQIFNRGLDVCLLCSYSSPLANSLVFSSREARNKYFRKVAIHTILLIKSRENFCLLSALQSRYSRTCLLENVYVTSVSVIVGVRCAVRVRWLFPCDEDY